MEVAVLALVLVLYAMLQLDCEIVKFDCGICSKYGFD